MSRRSSYLPPTLRASALAASFLTLGCGADDYFAVADLQGEGNELRIEFVYTCGPIDLVWDGTFVDRDHPRAELVVQVDAPGGDCDENPRWETFDLGPMKRKFREGHPWPAPLGLRIGPFEEEQGGTCLRNVFQTGPFKSVKCK